MSDVGRPIDALLAAEVPMELIFDELWYHEYSNVDNTLSDLIGKFRSYGQTCRAFKSHTKKLFDRNFGQVTIRNLMQHRNKFWSKTEALEENFEDNDVLVNEFRVDFEEIPSLLKIMIHGMNVNIKFVDIFPIDYDTFGCPPQNLVQMLMPLTKVRHEIEDLILATSSPKSEVPINIIAQTLSDLPNMDFVEKLTLGSTFLEYTADNIDYSLKSNEKAFFTYIQSLFKNLKCDDLTMILCDCINTFDRTIVSGGVMTVPSFFPMELLRITLKSLKPRILSLKIRTEATTSFYEAYRMDWDENHVFTNVVLFNSEFYTTVNNKSIQDPEDEDKSLTEIVLIVDTTDAHTWDVIEFSDFWATGRDFLLIFPMKQMIVGIRITLDQKSVIEQVQNTLDDVLNTFWMYPLFCKGRKIHVQLHFASSKGPVLSRRIMRKAVVREYVGNPLRVQYNEQPSIDFFEKYCDRLEARFSVQSETPFYVSLYDDAIGTEIHFKLVDIEDFFDDQ